VDVRLLGSVQATSDGRPIPLGAAKERALLAILALHAGSTVPTDRLIDGLWGEQPPASAVKLVQLYVSHLRRSLGKEGAAIVTHGRGYGLELPPDAVDAVRFERLVLAVAGDAEPVERAREALDLWAGEALQDVADEPFAAVEVRRLEALRLEATELAIDADLAAGRHAEATIELERLVAEHPLHERLHAQRVLALYRCRRQAEALNAYTEARRILDAQVGLEPGAELRALQQSILVQDPALDLPSRRSAATRPPSRARRTAVALVVAVVVGGLLVLVLGADGTRAPPPLGENAAGLIDLRTGGSGTQFAVGHDPRAAVAGAGSIWVTSGQDGIVTRIDLHRRLLATIDAGADLGAAAFADGSLWVARRDGTLTRIDARSNRPIRAVPLGSPPGAVAAGAGAVWVTTPLTGELTRLDLATGRRVVVAVGPGAGAVAAGPDAAWVALHDAGTAVRIEPRTGQVVDSVDVGRSPSAVALTPGAVWVANRDDGTVSRIDARRDAVTTTVAVGGGPVALAARGRTLWVALADARQVVAIDTRTERVRRRFAANGSPAALAVLDGRLWAAAAASPAGHRGGTLRTSSRSVDVEPATGGYDADATRLLSIVYDGLVSYRRTGGTAGWSLVGDLATGVPRPSPDGRTYVFTLRPGLRYSDGSAVRATDFRRSLERTFRVGKARIAALYQAIRGAPRCLAAPARCDLRTGIGADEAARTVTLRLSHPDPGLVYALQSPRAAFVRPTRLGHSPLGTGPYRVARHIGGRVTLVRNPAFRSWSTAATPDGVVDRIEITRSQGLVGAAADVARGQSDLVPQVAPISAAVLDRFAPLVHSAPFAMTDYAFLDTRRRPFDHRAARFALGLALDRRLMARRSGGPQAATPSCQVLPVGFPGYRPACRSAIASRAAGAWVTPDVPRARGLVRASGTRGTRVVVWAGPHTFAHATDVRDVLGLLGYRPVVRRFATDDAYFAALRHGGRPQVGFSGWIADDPRPESFTRALVSCDAGGRGPAATNWSRFCDRGLDAAIARAGRRPGAPSPSTWTAIESRIAALAPVIPFDTRRTVALAARQVGNLVFSPSGGVLLDRLWVR
jgi:peptide/nickel transport system substrate-binding protein